jgi:signal transduction histidine kinase
MKFFVRFLSVTVAILGLLLVTSVFGQRWLARQHEAMRTELAESKRTRLERVAQLAKLGPAPWDDATTRLVLDAVGGERLAVLSAAPGAPAKGDWFVDVRLTPHHSSEQVVRLWYAPPQASRLLGLYQRAGLVLVLLTLSCGVLLGAVFLLRGRGRWSETGETRSPFAADVRSLAGLAKVSVEQGVQLERERNERLRIQEDLNFQQVLLNRALEEKIRLGHDLHDGIIQSLYATGLTLEAAKNAAETKPAVARHQVEAALEMLNRTIRDVRSYILGLAPENIRVQSFGDAVKSVTETLGTGAAVEFEISIDDAAAAKLSEEQYADLVQIVRESVSNSIRHGQARKIGISLAQLQGEICLVIEDNGRGFAMDRAQRGHGLDNIEARAERLSAQARCTSTPGSGTRIVVTFRSTS